MLVVMEHTGSLQMAYQAATLEVCGVCKNVIAQGTYFTRHLAPNPWRRNETLSYLACQQCFPFQMLEQRPGGMSLQESAYRLMFACKETRVEIPAVQAKTLHALPDGEKGALDAVVQVRQDNLHTSG